jgi:GNAT superfamily N-acetyltransferase
MTLMTDRTGTAWRVRKLWPHERQHYIRHLLRLDVSSRLQRFGAAMSDDALASHARHHFAIDSLIYGLFLEGALRAAGELHGTCCFPRIEGEGAFSVESRYRHLGIGSALFDAIGDAARNRRFRRLRVMMLPGNHAMRAIASRHGGWPAGAELDAVWLVPLPLLTPWTMLSEMKREADAWHLHAVDQAQPDVAAKAQNVA